MTVSIQPLPAPRPASVLDSVGKLGAPRGHSIASHACRTKGETVKQGDVVDNETICHEFLCSPQGGMRRSLRTNSLVLISGTKVSIYGDRWDGDICHYT